MVCLLTLNLGGARFKSLVAPLCIQKLFYQVFQSYFSYKSLSAFYTGKLQDIAWRSIYSPGPSDLHLFGPAWSTTQADSFRSLSGRFRHQTPGLSSADNRSGVVSVVHRSGFVRIRPSKTNELGYIHPSSHVTQPFYAPHINTMIVDFTLYYIWWDPYLSYLCGISHSFIFLYFFANFLPT